MCVYGGCLGFSRNHIAANDSFKASQRLFFVLFGHTEITVLSMRSFAGTAIQLHELRATNKPGVDPPLSLCLPY